MKQETQRRRDRQKTARLVSLFNAVTDIKRKMLRKHGRDLSDYPRSARSTIVTGYDNNVRNHRTPTFAYPHLKYARRGFDVNPQHMNRGRGI